MRSTWWYRIFGFNFVRSRENFYLELYVFHPEVLSKAI